MPCQAMPPMDLQAALIDAFRVTDKRIREWGQAAVQAVFPCVMGKSICSSSCVFAPTKPCMSLSSHFWASLLFCSLLLLFSDLVIFKRILLVLNHFLLSMSFDLLVC